MESLENGMHVKNLLEDFLSVYWLRPETALWRTIDVLAMDALTFESPTLDLGCGDGIFSFIRAGGKFDLSFDMFKSITELDRYFENIDIYNFYDEKKVCPIIKKLPDYKIDVALDHKENLLRKSATLGLYNKFVCHNANKRLPFEDNTFKTIFSNVIYWLDKPADVFKEIRRILMTSGRAVVMLPNSSLKEYSFYYRLYVKTGDPSWQWLEKIDRGRLSENIKHTNNDEEWRSMFSESGLEVVRHTNHLSKTIIEAWDIGLRPLFPLLYKMTSKLNECDLLEIKKEWIALFSQFLLPLCSVTWCTDSVCPPAFHCYVLQKN